MPEPFTELLASFAAELRAAGLAVGSGDVLVYCAALSELDPADLGDLYWAGRATLVNRHDDIASYDEVFRRFFLGAGGPDEQLTLMLRASLQAQGALAMPSTEPGEDGEQDDAVLGRKPGSSPLCGFSHTSRWLSRVSRSSADASTAGSPRSKPSEQITTMPPRHTPRRAQPRTKASRLSPILVPPSQSNAVRAARSRASSGRRHSIAPVTRVSRAPKQKTSTRPADRFAECANCSRLRE